MKRSFRGLGVYIVILLVIMLIWWSFDGGKGLAANDYSYRDFVTALENEEIANVTVKQNKEVPTGVVTIVMKSGERYQMNVTDVNDVIGEMQQNEFSMYSIKDVPGENILTSLLPTILIIIAMVFLFMIVTGQSNSGGSNAKMMNFGRSRAKLVSGEEVKVKFANVAGLQEEKEDRKSTRLNSSHSGESRMPSSA